MSESTMFSESQLEDLKSPLPKEAVKSREGGNKTTLQYIAGHFAIEQANRIFGFGMWSSEIQHLHQVDKSIETKEKTWNGKTKEYEMVTVAYLCQLKLLVRDASGNESFHEDTGFGNGTAGNHAYGLGQCIELATKEAVTDALKRCLRHYGDQFGLSLYDKDEELLPSDVIESTKVVSVEQLAKLRALYKAREIGDSWVSEALSAEGYHGTIEDMNVDWWRHAMTLTRNYRLDEIEAAALDEDLDKLFGLMRQSVNMNMLKGLFRQAWDKTKKFDNKEKQREAQTIYEEMKSKLEEAA